ncbi:hypothetical protein [Belnapia arida]|uniref:hypothetical protein n=1 Tax=Belnapia arida TaxID=2804533 RepID=UPI001F43B739|nr:hypothetical protein [Belnapia arida]
MPELGDEQLEVRHHRPGTGGPRLRLLPRQLRGGESGAEGGNVVGSAARLGHHGGDRITLRPWQEAKNCRALAQSRLSATTRRLNTERHDCNQRWIFGAEVHDFSNGG